MSLSDMFFNANSPERRQIAEQVRKDSRIKEMNTEVKELVLALRGVSEELYSWIVSERWEGAAKSNSKLNRARRLLRKYGKDFKP